MGPSTRLERFDDHSDAPMTTVSTPKVLRRESASSPSHFLRRGVSGDGTLETLHRIERLLQQRLGDIDEKLEGLTSKVTPPLCERAPGNWMHETSTPQRANLPEELPRPPLPCEPEHPCDERVPARQSCLTVSTDSAEAMGDPSVSSIELNEHSFPVSADRVPTSSSTRIGSASEKLGDRSRYACRMRIQTFLEEPSSSCMATIYARVMFLFIMVSVCMPLLQTLKRPLMSSVDSLIFEMTLDMIFLIEAVVRWFTYPSCVGFLWVPYNVLDLCVACPLVLRTFLSMDVVKDGRFSQTFLFCIVPVLRLLKALRTFPNLKLVYYALSITREALTVPLFLLLVLTLIFSSLFFLIEPRDNIETMPHAMWFVIVTVTTVGYGDVSPETVAGKVVASVLSVTGVLYMAMPLTIVGAAFDYTWKNRDAIILGGLMQQRMCQWGLSETDLDLMFKHFDNDGSGELGVAEFMAMLEEMQLGLSTKSILQIFKAFDRDGSGSVKFGELAHWIFPGVIVEEL